MNWRLLIRMVTLYLSFTKKNLLSNLPSISMFLCVPSNMRMTLLRVISSSCPPLNTKGNDHQDCLVSCFWLLPVCVLSENKPARARAGVGVVKHGLHFRSLGGCRCRGGGITRCFYTGIRNESAIDAHFPNAAGRNELGGGGRGGHV